MPHPTRVSCAVLITQSIIICILIAIGVMYDDNDVLMFEEEGFATIVSVFQLLLLSLQSFSILFLRYRTTKRLVPHLVWALTAVGFIALSLDEYLMLHERFDFFLHTLFNIKETKLSDRIDDLVIGLYGMISAWVMYRWRHEVARYAPVNKLLILGFTSLLATIILDALRHKVLLEEIAKLMAESVFICAFYSFFYYASQAKTQKELNTHHSAIESIKS